MECPHKSITFNGIKRSLSTDCFYNMPVEGEAGFCKRPEYYRCIEDVNRLVIPLSYSSVSNFLTCHNLFYLKNIRGIEMRSECLSGAIKMGVLWDACVQKLLGADIAMNEIRDRYEMDDMAVARVRGLYRAYKALGLEVDKGYELQHTFKRRIQVVEEEMHGENSGVLVTGIFDRKYEKSFAENKLSSRPEFYFDMFFIQSQAGAYFLADENLEWVDMEVVRTPALKAVGKFKEELAQEHEERVYMDAIGRPSFYFLGYNKDKMRYGKRFYRSEFDLAEILERFRSVSREINEACAWDGFYKNDRACNNILPGISCDMISVCRHNTMAENIFKIREIPLDKQTI
jgi:hypothetical protein